MKQENMKSSMVANFNLVFYGENGSEEPCVWRKEYETREHEK
nr:MAG TPA: hypothetical protein [Caudoviricetes sp.]